MIRGRNDTRDASVGLRADMDCLPMHETNEFAHKSRTTGACTRCGHDGHTTMLLGAARYLAETRDFDGTAYLIFQPGEEGDGGGARDDRGRPVRALSRPTQVYALHNWPGLPPGRSACAPGPVMAATDEIEIDDRRQGRSRRACRISAIDPVVVAAHIITALQTIVSRNVSPLDTVVVSICSMQTSQLGAFNVIPGACRSWSARCARSARRRRTLAERRLARDRPDDRRGVRRERARSTTSASIRRPINTRREAQFAADVGESAGRRATTSCATSTRPWAREDFSYMLQAKPGAYVRLGQGGGEGGCFLHNPNYDFNDDVIPLGAGYLAALAEQAMPLPHEVTGRARFLEACMTRP